MLLVDQPCAAAPLRYSSYTETIAKHRPSLVQIEISPPLQENTTSNAITIWQILNKPHALAL